MRIPNEIVPGISFLLLVFIWLFPETRFVLVGIAGRVPLVKTLGGFNIFELLTPSAPFIKV